MNEQQLKRIVMKRLAEICCGSYEDALAAYRGGAKRIELNSALHLGGLTPSVGALILTKKNTDLKVIAMVRPRGAGFHYSPADFDAMKLDAGLMLQNGADGIAFGCLDESGNIEKRQTREMVDIIKQYCGDAVFHRAFDCVRDSYESIETLISIGIDRVLTSGLKANVMEGMPLIADLQKKYGHKIEILAGGGINAFNAKGVMDRTGIFQVHSSCKGWRSDPTTMGKEVTYAYALSPHEKDYEVVDERLVKELCGSL